MDFIERLETSEQLYGSFAMKKKDDVNKGQRATVGDSQERKGTYQSARRNSSSRQHHSFKKRKYVT